MAGSTHRIRILFLIDELHPGGTEKQLVLIAGGLPADQFDPVIGLIKNDPHVLPGVSVPVVHFGRSGSPLARRFKTISALRAFLAKERIDILQTHFADSEIYGALAVRSLRRKPIVISTRRNLYHWASDEPWGFRLSCLAARWSDRFLVNSHCAMAELAKRENTPQEKIKLIQNAVEVDTFNVTDTGDAKRAIGLADESPVIGVVGNWRPVKGLISFLHAAERVSREIPSAKFVLVGFGPQEDELKALTRKLDIQGKVVFLANSADIATIMSAFDVAVQSSLSESFSNVLVEYMASARPVVATKVGDAEHVIDHGKCGLLVQPDHPQQLAEAILLLCRDKDKAFAFGKTARKKVRERWSADNIQELYRSFYLETFGALRG